MLIDHLLTQIDSARTATQLDVLCIRISKDRCAGDLNEDEWTSLYELCEDRKAELAPVNRDAQQVAAPLTPPPKQKREPRSPDRIKSRGRQDRLLDDEWLPACIRTMAGNGAPAIAAVWSVWARDIAQHGVSNRCTDATAALAGCSARTVRRARARAEQLSLFRVVMRRRGYDQSLPHLVFALRADLKDWLSRKKTKIGGHPRPPSQQDTGTKKHLHAQLAQNTALNQKRSAVRGDRRPETSERTNT